MTCTCGRRIVRCTMPPGRCIAWGWTHPQTGRHRCPGRQAWARPAPVMFL